MGATAALAPLAPRSEALPPPPPPPAEIDGLFGEPLRPGRPPGSSLPRMPPPSQLAEVRTHARPSRPPPPRRRGARGCRTCGGGGLRIRLAALGWPGVALASLRRAILLEAQVRVSDRFRYRRTRRAHLGLSTAGQATACLKCFRRSREGVPRAVSNMKVAWAWAVGRPRSLRRTVT